jgi:hypothetical protein
MSWDGVDVQGLAPDTAEADDDLMQIAAAKLLSLRVRRR